jgi:hypothetical protein
MEFYLYIVFQPRPTKTRGEALLWEEILFYVFFSFLYKLLLIYVPLKKYTFIYLLLPAELWL